MDGVSWSTSRSQESFSHSTTADTLSKLASFIARSNTRQHAQSEQQLSHLQLYICPECGKGFPYAADLLQHQELKHTLPKPHRCPSCGQEFSLRSSLQLHRCRQDAARCERCRAPSRLGPLCPACTTWIPDPGKLQDKPLHHPPHFFYSSPYACAPCGRSFSQKQALLQHQQAGCSEPPSNAAGGLPDDSPPVSEGDSARSDLSDAPELGGRVGGVCRACSSTFRTDAALQRHKQNNHVEEKPTPGGSSDDDDDEDDDEESAEAPGAHQRSKPKKRLLSCRSCDLVFRTTSMLCLHRKKMHRRKKPTRREKPTRKEPMPFFKKPRKLGVYPCQICCIVFFHHLSLRAHLKRHTPSQAIKNEQNSPEHPPIDSAPSENFPNKTGFPPKDSEPSENGPNKIVRKRKPGPGWPQKVPSALKVRIKAPERAEEEEKEFPCPSCPEVFSLQQQLKEHMELHQASDQRRQCSVCSSHMESCEGPGSRRHRLYHCVPCQLGFSALDSFLQHCQQHLRVRVEEDRISEGFRQHKA